MRKFKLELDALKVQSYNTTPAEMEVKGTVQGAEVSDPDCTVITGAGKTRCSLQCSYCITCLECGDSDLGTCDGQFTCGGVC